MVRLRDICAFQSGGTPSRQNPEYFNGDIPWVTTTALNGSTISLENANEWITLKAIDESAAKLVPAHSILVGTRVGVGKVAINLVPMSTSQDIISLIGIDQNQWDLEFLCKFLSSKSAYLNSQARGATIKGIKIETLAELELPNYSIPEQRLISSTFNLLEKSIFLRKQQLSKLDELVKSRFIEMFGDQRTNPFGWDMVTIGDIATEVRYGTSRPAVEGGKYPYLRMNNLTYEGYLDLADLKYIDIPDNEIEKCVVRNGDVLFNRTNSVELVGKTCVYDLDYDMVIAGYIIRVRIDDRMLPVVLSNYLNSAVLKEQLRSMAKGAVNQANINAQELQSIPIYLPPIDLQHEFVAFVEQIDKSKFEIQKSLEKLETLKKALMQKYFG